MGKLNLLHHKTWHVYGRDNRERVRKDEEIEDKKQLATDTRKQQAKQERKLNSLRAGSANHTLDPINSIRRQSAKEKEPEKHVNLFADYEKRLVAMDQLKDTDKKKDEEKWEKQFTTYLGTGDGKELVKPWYSLSQIPGPNPVGEKKAKSDEYQKRTQDPLIIIEKHTSKEALIIKHAGAKKETDEMALTGLEKLRFERLKREREERVRTQELLNPQLVYKHELDESFYNSQFNPDLVRGRSQARNTSSKRPKFEF